MGENTIDIANSSRKIKPAEQEECAKAGVADIVEVKFGYDGIVFAVDSGAGEWKLEPKDLYAYARSVALNASGARLADFIATAQPPNAEGADDVTTTSAAEDTTTTAAAGAVATEGEANTTMIGPTEEQGSNGWAIGSKNSEEGGGMLLANPHFPWQGELRFWESHLTVTGDDPSDIYGAQLLGLPGVGIGATDEFAWTHTVSDGNRFTAYKLTLAPDDPTAYVVDGETVQMTSKDVTIEVADASGETTEQSRTMWSTEFGPVIDFPGVGWTDETAITYRDANIDNDEFVEQYRAIDTAQSFDEFVDAHADIQGVPLFNTVAVSKDGRAWYADTSATPNLSDEAIDAYEDALENDPITRAAADSGAVLLDGSKGYNRWEEVDGARDPGLVPYSKMPQLERDDYVFNANDSFWLANRDQLIEGDYSPLHGAQDTERSVRTLQNLSVLDGADTERLAGDDNKFGLEELQVAALDDNAYTAAQLRTDVVARCEAASDPVKVEADLGALGFLVGREVGNGVPLLRGVRHEGLALRSLGAAMAASGAVALYHVEGVTPEAKDGVDLAPGHRELAVDDLAPAYDALNGPAEQIDLVSLGCPHASLAEIEAVAGYLDGRRLAAALWITTSRATRQVAEQAGLVARIETAGGRVVADTCMVVAPVAGLGFRSMATNSAKMAFYAPSHSGLSVRFGPAEQCLEAALEGRWPEPPSRPEGRWS